MKITDQMVQAFQRAWEDADSTAFAYELDLKPGDRTRAGLEAMFDSIEPDTPTSIELHDDGLHLDGHRFPWLLADDGVRYCLADGPYPAFSRLRVDIVFVEPSPDEPQAAATDRLADVPFVDVRTTAEECARSIEALGDDFWCPHKDVGHRGDPLTRQG